MVNTDQSFKKLSLTSNYKIHSYTDLESVRKKKQKQNIGIQNRDILHGDISKCASASS